MFITFEGPEGSGKSTQIALLEKFFKQIKKDFITIREPGGTVIGEEVRKILISSKSGAISDQAELFLFLSSRAELVEKIIKPALKNNKIVLCDRFVDSTLAYQGFGRGMDLDKIKTMNEFVTDGLYPDLTFLLQLDVNTSFERLNNRYSKSTKKFDRIENEDRSFHKKIHDGYNEIYKSSKRIFKIDASLSVHTVENLIKNKILEVIR